MGGPARSGIVLGRERTRVAALVIATAAVIGLSVVPAKAVLPSGALRLYGVVTAGGSPVQDAQVDLCGPDPTCDSVKTDTNGSYEFPGIAAGSYTLNVYRPDARPYLLGLSNVDVTVDGDTERNLVLTIGGRFSLAVVLPNGLPAADQNVSVCRTSPSGDGACPTIAWSDLTDASGLATTTTLPPGDYAITAGNSNGPSAFPRTVNATMVADTTTSVPTITLMAPASLGGYVRDVGNNPVVGAYVQVVAPGLASSNATTDASGHYSIASARPATYGGTVYPPSGAVLGKAPFADLVLGEGATVQQDFVLRRRAAIYATSSSSVGPTSSGSVAACLAPGAPRFAFTGYGLGADCGDASTGPAVTFTGHVELAGDSYNVGNGYLVSGAVVTSPIVAVTLTPGQVVACDLVAGAPGSAGCGAATDGSWVFATVTDDQGASFASNGAITVCNGTFNEAIDPSAVCSGAVSAYGIADAVGHATAGPLPPGALGVRGSHTVFSPTLAMTWNTATSVTLVAGNDQTCTAPVPGSTSCTAGTPAWAGQQPALITIAGTVTGNLGTSSTVVGCRGTVDPDTTWAGSGNACGGAPMTTASVNLGTGAFVMSNGGASLAAGTYHLRAYALVDGARVAGNAQTVTLATSSVTGVGLGFPPPNVATVTPTTGTDPVTITSPAGSAIANLTAAPPPSQLPDGATSFPAGVIGFSLKLAAGQTSGDVTLVMPAGSAPDSYWKLVGGVWTKVPTSGPGSFVTFSGDSVTLHLVDNDQFDTDPTDGVIGDPGGPSHTFKFTSFRSPIVLPTTSVKAGSMVPVKWRVTNALGVPSSDPASFASLTVTAPAASCGSGALSTLAANASALRYNGAGEWQFDLKTPNDKSSVGKCSTLSLQLSDGSSAHTVKVQFTK